MAAEQEGQHIMEHIQQQNDKGKNGHGQQQGSKHLADKIFMQRFQSLSPRAKWRIWRTMQSEFHGKRKTRGEGDFAARLANRRFADYGNGGPVTMR